VHELKGLIRCGNANAVIHRARRKMLTDSMIVSSRLPVWRSQAFRP
jgi:hypothetical protein